MIAIIFDFLAILSLTISIIGLLNNKHWLLAIGAVLVLPFSYLLSSELDFSGFIFLPLFYLGSAVAVYLRNRPFAWLMFLPVLLLALFLLTLVFIFTQ